MWQLVAADLPTNLPATQPSDNTTAYLTFFGGIIATFGLIAVAWINSKKEKTSPSPPPPVDPDSAGTTALRVQVAVNESKLAGLLEDADEMAETVEIVDRRISRVEIGQERADSKQQQIVRFLDRSFPDWKL